ncbi:helix-turn-helix domain-containing protein [Clostridium ihumii]|uniref:helix-turn-helix domain-containing protein n=1 Tax=Clostridium ihumii TaxID=1470356 RepID=UPI00058CAD04|nr:helix-turn-helix domain-containing protein [Clostridium ihumii]
MYDDLIKKIQELEKENEELKKEIVNVKNKYKNFGRQKMLNKNDIENITLLKSQGTTIKKLQELYGCSRSTIQRALRK